MLDFFDDDIEEKLRALEAEEAQLEAAGAYAPEEDSDNDLDEEEIVLHKAIRSKQIVARNVSHETKTNLPRRLALKGTSSKDIKKSLDDVGLSSEGVVEHTRGRKRERSVSRPAEGMEVDESALDKATIKRSRSKSLAAVKMRPKSATKGTREGSVAPRQLKEVEKSKKTLERHLFKYAKGGEADRRHYEKMAKHLNSGKSSLGTSTIGR